MKQLILVIALSFFCSASFAQVEGVEVEKPQEETKKEEKKEDKKEKDDKEEMSLIDRFYFGGNLGLGFGTITNINVSPMVGFRLTPRFSVGVGANYQYWKDKRFNPAFVQNIYGASLFSRFVIAEDFLNAGNLFAHAEYEQLYAKARNYNPNTGLYEDKTKMFPSTFIGAGMAFPIGNRSAFTVSLLYNPFYDQYNSLYGNAFQIRTGAYF
jgi:hypothetical protein